MAPTRTASASSSSAKASSSKAAGKRAAKSGASAQQEQAGEPAVLPMGKLLASTEKRTRDAAVRSLAAFLAQTGDEPISSLEMAKLWKGIFYCFWMSDKPLVQQALAQELADLVLTVPGTSRVPAPLVAGFDSSAGNISKRARGGLAMLEGFWDAMAREWSGLDKWRINKFYLLLRRFLNAAFRLLSLEKWDPAAVDHLGRLLVKKADDGKKSNSGSSSSSGPLCANDVKVPDSLTYHLTDVWLDELERALVSPPPVEGDEDDDEEGMASKAKRNANFSLVALLKPMAQTAATCHSSTVFDKIMDNVLKPLLDDCLMVAAEDEEDSIADAEEEDAQRSAKRRKTSPAEEEEEEKGSAAAYPSILTAARKAGQSPLALRASVYKMLFEAASREDALPQRRRRLYAFCQEERERREEVGEESGEE